MGIQERKEREKEQRREEILNAAQYIFFDKGLQAATMDDIADKAELSKGTLYLYFSSKEDLYLAVLLRGLGRLHEMFLKVVAEKKPVLILLDDFQQAYVQFFKEHTNYFRMLDFFETPQFHKQVSADMKDQCAEATEKLWQVATELIVQAVTAGLLKPSLNPRQTAVMLWVNLNSFLRHMDRYDQYWKEKIGIDLEDTLSTFSRLIFEALMTEKGNKLYSQYANNRGKNE